MRQINLISVHHTTLEHMEITTGKPKSLNVDDLFEFEKDILVVWKGFGQMFVFVIQVPNATTPQHGYHPLQCDKEGP